jgi:ABC-2 type transport system permease protein
MTDSIAAPANAARAAGTIYDLGYQHYDGPRLGRWSVIRTLAAFSFRTAFGTGRGNKSQIIPYLVLLLVYLPAMIMVAIASALGRPESINYAQYLPAVTFLLALFTAAQSAEVIVTDRQYGVLALYLSRALGTTDYIAAKLIAFTGALLVLTLGPQLVLFSGKVLIATSPWDAWKSNYKDLLPIFGGTILAACYMSFIGLALASFAARRAYAAASVIAFFVFMPAVANIARVIITNEDNRRFTVLANPFVLITGFCNWLFDVQVNLRATRNQFNVAATRTVVRAALPGQYYLYVMLGTCVIALALLMLRYRRTEV